MELIRVNSYSREAACKPISAGLVLSVIPLVNNRTDWINITEYN